MTERLCKEWDGMSQTMERLRSEHNTAHAEHDAAQLQIGSLQSELERQRNQKLEAESVSTRLAVELAWDRAKAQGLEKELAEVKGSLQRESEDHDNMCITISLVYNDLGVTPARDEFTRGSRLSDHGPNTRTREGGSLCRGQSILRDHSFPLWGEH
jgi:chromosome segregation ATPase